MNSSLADSTQEKNDLIKQIVLFARPFTLLAPAIGFLCGGLAAVGFLRNQQTPFSSGMFWKLIVGTIAAGLMNAYSNAINQIFDIDIDRINKPKRPLPSGGLTMHQGWIVGISAAVIAVLLAFSVSLQFSVLILLAGVFTTLYSAPPFRCKKRLFLANVVIAIPRGCLVTVAGWSAISTAFHPEPWLLSSILGFFVLGAASTKDFSDISGDKQYGCETLPVRFGIKKSIIIIIPFLTLPFLLLPMYSLLGYLNNSKIFTILLGFALSGWGTYVAYLLLKHPEELATEANHVSWKHMYLLMVFTSIGIAVSYFV